MQDILDRVTEDMRLRGMSEGTQEVYLNSIARYLRFIYVALIALFLLWAWKLWHGKWLRSISGNTFATMRELELSYQKRMGRETSVLVAACALLFAMLTYNEAFGMELNVLLAASAAFFVFIVAGSIVIAVRANRAAKEEQADAGLREMGWPSKERDPELGGGKAFPVIQWICFGFAAMLPTIVIFAAYFLGWID